MDEEDSTPASEDDQRFFQKIAEEVRWIDPRIATDQRFNPVLPFVRRKEGSERRRTVVNGLLLDDNQWSQDVFWTAYSTTSSSSGLWVCHVWPGSAANPRLHTDLRNLCAVPANLSSLTDGGPFSAILQDASRRLYGWDGPASLDRIPPPNIQCTWPQVQSLAPREVEQIRDALVAVQGRAKRVLDRNGDSGQ